MPKFKVVNPDAPEEIDFYQDIPLVDPDTGADQLDSDGNILVKRYVNHTVSLKGINKVKDALPAIKTNTKKLEELYQYSHTQNEAHQKAINENSNAIVELNTSTSGMALDLETLKNKINGIQGINIDDLKDYVNTQIPLIKNSYLPLVGGTITGNLTIEEGTITGSLTGVASKATADVNNKALTSYIADIMGANAQLSIIKGDGTTSVLSINNVLNATKATQDSAGNIITNTYVKKTGDETIEGVKEFKGTVKAHNFIEFHENRSGIGGGLATFLGDYKVADLWGQPGDANSASLIHLRIKDYQSDDNLAYLVISGNNQTKQGAISFNGKNLVRSVNGVNADVNGNVQLGNGGAITGKTGKIEWFAFNTPPDGYLVCNGANVSRETYADLFAVIGTTFGNGDGSTTFTLPNLIDKFAQGSTTVGTVKSAGLPNITGYLGAVKSQSYYGASGAFYSGKEWNGAPNDNGNASAKDTSFAASRSNSIYGKSQTVQPPALTLLPCIKY